MRGGGRELRGGKSDGVEEGGGGSELCVYAAYFLLVL